MTNKVGYRKRYPILYCGLFGLFEDKKIRPERRIFQSTTITATTIRFLQRKKTDAVADYSLYYIRNSLSD